MDIGYWKNRWQQGEIGFHEGAPNTLLTAHEGLLREGSRVLVPLCGKSVDLAWLASRGHGVTGVEVARTAIDAFYSEQQLPHETEARAPFVLHRGGGVEIAEGDMFAATPALLGTFDAAYDRAALIALAPMTRLKYVETLRALLRPKARMLLITLQYDQRQMAGPPWSIEGNVVRSLFRRHFVVEPLETRPTELSAKTRAAGVTAMTESAFLLHRF